MINKKETKEVLASKKEQKKVNDKGVKEKKVKTVSYNFDTNKCEIKNEKPEKDLKKICEKCLLYKYIYIKTLKQKRI